MKMLHLFYFDEDVENSFTETTMCAIKGIISPNLFYRYICSFEKRVNEIDAIFAAAGNSPHYCEEWYRLINERSMCVGDVVYDDKSKQLFLCIMAGWKTIPMDSRIVVPSNTKVISNF